MAGRRAIRPAHRAIVGDTNLDDPTIDRAVGDVRGAINTMRRLPRFDAKNDGYVPKSPGGTGTYLRADGTWGTPAGAGDVLHTRSITAVAPATGGGDLSADRTISVQTFGAAQSGVVPLSGGGTTNFLRADGTWASPATSAAKMFDVDTGLIALTNAGNENNVNFGALGQVTYCRFGTTVNEHITGVSNNGVACGVGDNGRVICLYNEGTGPGVGNNAFINSQDANSTASNRLVTAGGGIINIILGQGIFFRYNGSYLRWMQLSS